MNPKAWELLKNGDTPQLTTAQLRETLDMLNAALPYLKSRSPHFDLALNATINDKAYIARILEGRERDATDLIEEVHEL